MAIIAAPADCSQWPLLSLFWVAWRCCHTGRLLHPSLHPLKTPSSRRRLRSRALAARWRQCERGRASASVAASASAWVLPNVPLALPRGATAAARQHRRHPQTGHRKQQRRRLPPRARWRSGSTVILALAKADHDAHSAAGASGARVLRRRLRPLHPFGRRLHRFGHDVDRLACGHARLSNGNHGLRLSRRVDALAGAARSQRRLAAADGDTDKTRAQLL